MLRDFFARLHLQVNGDPKPLVGRLLVLSMATRQKHNAAIIYKSVAGVVATGFRLLMN
jgi:hypothetical protein